MFEKSREDLAKLGADITTAEIAQQPDLWEDAFSIYQHHAEVLKSFLSEAIGEAKAQQTRLSVIFTGAGTSAYVSDTVVPHLIRHGKTEDLIFRAVATTDIVAAPLDYLEPDQPTILVSFARSGNSPESLAAVQLGRQLVKNIRFLNITCAPEGKLAQEAEGDERSLTILIPRANDRGFAMTGSYSCMTLMSLLAFDQASDEDKQAWVKEAARLGRDVIAREAEVAAFLADGFERITYLGSSSLSGLAREAQLKVLELAAGKVATSFDSSMGYRHGPKSFVDAETLVFVFVSNDPYTRDYDLDILKEISSDGIAKHVVAIQQESASCFEGESFNFDGSTLPGAYLALPFVMVAQTISLLNSVRVGNTPDTPSANGTVNRVVKGVSIHPFKA